MKKKNTSQVREHLGWHLSRVNTLVLLLQGLIGSSHVTLSRIASCCGSKVHNASLQKRFSRFFKEIEIDSLVWAKLILKLINIPKRVPLELLIDRTNWERGKKSINFLVIAIRWKKTAIPLFVKAICEQKGGNSTLGQVEKILKMVIQAFGKKRIRMLIGDREFGALNKIELYQSLGIPFVVRLKEQWHYARKDENQDEVLLHSLFENLAIGRSQTINDLRLGRKGPIVCSVSAKRKSATELIIVAHSKTIKKPLKAYKRRWRIERAFLECKTQGFQLESTGITHPQRLQNLLMVIALASAMIISAAISHAKKRSIPIKKHGYPALSLFKSGLQFLRSSITLYLKHFQEIFR